MSCLDATFTLTPRSPSYSAGNQWSELFCYGADFLQFSPWDFSSLYSADRLFFYAFTAADPNIDNSQWVNRIKVPFIEFSADLSGYGTAKQLALIFGFEGNGRILVYTDAGLIGDQTLVPSDNQFLLEMDVPDHPFNLYFIHADGPSGHWFFRGLSGYVV